MIGLRFGAIGCKRLAGKAGGLEQKCAAVAQLLEPELKALSRKGGSSSTLIPQSMPPHYRAALISAFNTKLQK